MPTTDSTNFDSRSRVFKNLWLSAKKLSLIPLSFAEKQWKINESCNPERYGGVEE
jgi:hypothetical protein